MTMLRIASRCRGQARQGVACIAHKSIAILINAGSGSKIARRHRTILRTALPAAHFDGNKLPAISGKETKRAPRRSVAI
jgi:hypothetical protein